MKTKRKGTRAEHRAIRQVKAGTKYLSAVEREEITGLRVPANVKRESWRFPDRCRAPLIERL